jgi:hypothetical protein
MGYMLGMYLRELVRQAVKSSWVAANGLAGGLLGGGAMIWRGVISVVSSEAPSRRRPNWTLSFAVYAVVSWALPRPHTYRPVSSIGGSGSISGGIGIPPAWPVWGADAQPDSKQGTGELVSYADREIF